MQTPSQSIEGSAAQSGALVSQVNLARARELAKSGDYEAALVLLLQMEPTASALDLRARIEVQRGRYADARALWREVLDQAPDHAGATKGLRDVQRVAARGVILRRLGLASVLLAAAGIVALGLQSQVKQPAKAHVQPPSLPRTPASVPNALPAAAVAAPSASLPEIALPEGVSLRREHGAHLYSFDAGLFSQGVTFVPGGRERVTALGRALAPYAAEIQIELIGHVDTLPVPAERQFHDNTELALARANAVLGRLARTTRIAPETLGLRAVGARLGPFSDQQADPRNRTVAIRVGLRSQASSAR